jgi:tetratricopeptide (TPR) repeat protein/transglutaminase-like putative cysteine protease
MMPKPAPLVIFLLLAVSTISAFAQKNDSKQDFSREGVVIEELQTLVAFQSDGTSTREQRSRVRIQSDAGVQQYGLLRVPYIASIETVELRNVRVIKSNGSTVITPPDSIQDAPTELYRGVAEYTDLREKHLPVKSLEPGDILEYSIVWQVTKPLAPGQFWFSHQFVKSSVVLNERLEISFPREREVQQKSQQTQPTVREENGRRILTWTTSNQESLSLENQRESQGYALVKGLLPPADVLISSFHSWEEVGRWYEQLQREKIQPSPEIKAKAEELTKNLTDHDAKVKAIYSYVSLRYRYIAIALGIGRYQPHAATEILGNQYGDCKDKHTLLAALLKAVGINAYPALISSRTVVDTDVPSPGQFDHVISVVPQADTLLWMDTTPEVTPMGQLTYPLRAKPALLISPEKVSFQTTPANPIFANSLTNKLVAKINSEGTLQVHVDTSSRGDDELTYRYVLRRIPEAQWKDFAKQNFQGGRLGGTITTVTTSPPEKTDEPFVVSYDYTLKDFTEGDKHRFVIPLSPIALPAPKDQDMTRTIPLWIGYMGESNYESRIDLPKGWSVSENFPLDLKEPFAEYHSSSEVLDGVLITKRRLILKASEVTPDQLTRYRSFEKAISDDERRYYFLQHSNDVTAVGPALTPAEGIARFADLLRQGMKQLPGSSNSEADQAEQDARKSMQGQDFTAATDALKRAVALDPTFCRAWIELASTEYFGLRDPKSALNAFQSAIQADPKQVIPYKLLAFLYMGTGKTDDAIAIWQKLRTVAPEDRDLTSNLGSLYLLRKRYSEAATFFEAETKANPSNATVQLSLGMACLRLKNTDQGLAALHKALEIDSGAQMLNNVAYEMADAQIRLPDALTYSQRSLSDVEEQSRKVNIEKVEKADRLIPLSIAAYWDTLGWIYFKMGDLHRAESYLTSAWELGQYGVVGDHLGELYEKEGKLTAALRMYNLALEVDPRLEDTPARMRNLAKVPLPKNRMSAKEELSLMRTIKLPTITTEKANADFDVLIHSGKIEKVHFISGSDTLRTAGDTLEKTSFKQTFPPESSLAVIRKGTLSCSEKTCSFVFYPLAVAARAD